jgi:2-phosphoglycerate kinase
LDLRRDFRVSKTPVLVTDGSDEVPFLRGMVTHSLVGRGLDFREAYETANVVRERIRNRSRISRQELRTLINQVLEERYPESEFQRAGKIEPTPTVMVKGAESLPFSKGIVSQSLQASGLEPQDAYQIAQRIQISLLEQGLDEISTDDLRREIYRRVQVEHGKSFAERYVLWRYLKSPDKPLILLFGGATGVGKTSVANELAHRLGIGTVVSTDTVREMMRMMFSPELLPAIHASSFEAWKREPPREKPSKAAVNGFVEQSRRVQVGVRAMLERTIQENVNLVIEGVHLVPGLLKLQEFEDRAYIVFVVISTLSKSNYLKRFPARQVDSPDRPAQHYRENFKTILRIQDYILDTADNFDVPMVENESLDHTVASTLSVVTSSLREKLNIGSKELLERAL